MILHYHIVVYHIILYYIRLDYIAKAQSNKFYLHLNRSANITNTDKWWQNVQHYLYINVIVNLKQFQWWAMFWSIFTHRTQHMKSMCTTLATRLVIFFLASHNASQNPSQICDCVNTSEWTLLSSVSPWLHYYVHMFLQDTPCLCAHWKRISANDPKLLLLKILHHLRSQG